MRLALDPSTIILAVVPAVLALVACLNDRASGWPRRPAC